MSKAKKSSPICIVILIISVILLKNCDSLGNRRLLYEPLENTRIWGVCASHLR